MMKTTPTISLIPLLCLVFFGCDGDDGDGGTAPPTVTILRVSSILPGNGDGSSWGSGYRDLDMALADAADIDGDKEIWIAAGVYSTPGTGGKAAAFAMPSNTDLYGGFLGIEESRAERDWAANETILDGDGAEGVLAGYLIEGGTVDGFTIQNGNRTDMDSMGGGIYFTIAAGDDAPTVRNCRFLNNSADGFGGGMYCNVGTEVVNCIFIDNEADSGGGLAMSNDADDPMVVANCRFLGNGRSPLVDANRNGGGLWLSSSGETIVTNCLFSGNTADFGGGLYLIGAAGEDTTIVANCTFYGNGTPLANGVAGLRSYGSNALVANCVFWQNTDHDGALELAQLREEGPGELDIRYCTIENLLEYAGDNNDAGPAAFTDPDGADNRSGTADDDLTPTAAALIGTGSASLLPRDAGDLDDDGNTTEPTPVNLAGETRNNPPNRGCY